MVDECPKSYNNNVGITSNNNDNNNNVNSGNKTKCFPFHPNIREETIGMKRME